MSTRPTFALSAQEPVLGAKDPESLFKDPDAKLNRNEQAALHIQTVSDPQLHERVGPELWRKR